jgi:hypothetical protein
MSHECPSCGQECYCDGEDHGQEAPANCTHECEGEGDDADQFAFEFWQVLTDKQREDEIRRAM